MAEAAITNPNGALSSVTDYRTGRTADGQELQQGQLAWPYRANSAVTKGDVLMFIPPTATVPLSVAPMTAAITTSDAWAYAGVALDSAGVDQMVNVCVQGVCLVRHVAADTPAALDVAGLPQTTTGRAETNAAITGLFIFGTVLGPEVGTEDLCLVNLRAGGPVIAAT